jgi:uncharacterized protein YbjT (DUF2867 family)
MADVLVTGGTGHLGRELVPLLVAKGYDVRVLSRRERPAIGVGARAVRGDLVTGEGIDDAVAGCDILVHCASGTGTARGLLYRSARRTDVEATTRLLEATKRAGVDPYVLYISIVGIDRIPLGYYRAKLETEHVIETSGHPHTTLRTTQWHTLAQEFCQRLSRFPVVIVPKGISLQLLDPGEVAQRMVAHVEGGPVGRAPDMGGPTALGFPDVLRAYLTTTGRKRAVAKMTLPGRTMAAFRKGYNLSPEHADGVTTWEEWLSKNAAAT